MSDFWHAALGLFAAVAPFGAAPVFVALTRDSAPARRTALAVAGAALALGLLAAAALLSDPVLDWLDVSGENFQLAAGLIMLPQALQLLWKGESLTVEQAHGAWYVGALSPLAVPVLAGPASMAAALAYSSRYGDGEIIGASALVLGASAAVLLAAAWLGRRLAPLGFATLGRFSGALLVAIAVELVVDGVQSV